MASPIRLPLLMFSCGMSWASNHLSPSIDAALHTTRMMLLKSPVRLSPPVGLGRSTMWTALSAVGHTAFSIHRLFMLAKHWRSSCESKDTVFGGRPSVHAVVSETDFAANLISSAVTLASGLCSTTNTFACRHVFPSWCCQSSPHCFTLSCTTCWVPFWSAPSQVRRSVCLKEVKGFTRSCNGLR
jgi:hypothetical protein